MRLRAVLLLVLVMLGRCTRLIDAATYYCSADGSGAMNGLSYATRWPWTTAILAASTEPDDVVLLYNDEGDFDAGTTYLATHSCGTAGHPVTYRAAPGEDIIFSSAVAAYSIQFNPAADSDLYLAFEGTLGHPILFEGLNCTTGGVGFVDGDQVTFTYCSFRGPRTNLGGGALYDPYYKRNTGATVWGAGSTSDHITFTDCVFERAWVGVFCLVTGATDLTFTRCIWRNIGFDGVDSTAGANWTFDGCTFQNGHGGHAGVRIYFAAPIDTDADADLDDVVDKGGGLVGIPVANHGFPAGTTVSITGTTNYNATEVLDATTSEDEIVITAPYVAEDFAAGGLVSSLQGAALEVGDTVTQTLAGDDATGVVEYVTTNYFEAWQTSEADFANEGGIVDGEAETVCEPYYVDGAHLDWIQLELAGANVNLTIKNCIFYNNYGYTDGYGNSCMYPYSSTGTATGIYILNNVTYHTGIGYDILTHGCQGMYIIGNTFFANADAADIAGIRLSNAVWPGDTVITELRNNFISEMNLDADVSGKDASVTTHTNNFFRYGVTDPEGYVPDATEDVLVDFVATGLFTNYAAANFRLPTGSAGINAGVWSTYSTTDIEGTARQNPPDIGAYEYLGLTYILMGP